MWSCVTGLLHFIQCFQVSSILIPIPFYGQITLHCMARLHFIYPFISWTLWVVLLFGYYELCCYEHYVHVLCGCMFLFLFGVCLELELLDNTVILFNQLRLFSKVFVPIYTPTSSVWGSPHTCQHLLLSVCFLL